MSCSVPLTLNELNRLWFQDHKHLSTKRMLELGLIDIIDIEWVEELRKEMTDKIIYTTGFPRSGTWWITRLLSDVLNSPIKTLPPDNVTVSDFCKTGQGGYTILKSHWRVKEYEEKGNGLPIVFIQRDPRDVAVSAFYYRGSLEKTDENLLGVIQTMVTKDAHPSFKIYHQTGVYENWVREWLDHSTVIRVKYEDLHKSGPNEMHKLAHSLGEYVKLRHAQSSYDRQRFAMHKDKYPHSMRKGFAGDWRNHFKRSHGRLITEHLGGLMFEVGYIDSLDWWEGLKE